MVYLLNMVIFHGELLNNQRVNGWIFHCQWFGFSPFWIPRILRIQAMINSPKNLVVISTKCPRDTQEMWSQRSTNRLSQPCQPCDSSKKHEILVILCIELQSMAGRNKKHIWEWLKIWSPRNMDDWKKNILPSFFPVPKCSTYPQNFKMVPQIVNRSSTKARFRFRGFLCDGQNTGYAPILRKTMFINPIS